MDPLSGASAIATIVGLVCNFRSERQSAKQDDFNEFLRWIDSDRHEKLIAEMVSNHSLSLGVKALLNDNHEQIMAKLNALESSMFAVSAHLSGLKEISEALAPNRGLSNQAFSIIKQINDSGGSVFLELKMLDGTSYHIMDGSGQIELKEPRFVEDDLTQLCDFGFLIPDRNKRGERLFRFTRAAARLVQANEL